MSTSNSTKVYYLDRSNGQAVLFPADFRGKFVDRDRWLPTTTKVEGPFLTPTQAKIASWQHEYTW